MKTKKKKKISSGDVSVSSGDVSVSSVKKKIKVNGKQSTELMKILSCGGYSYDELLKTFSGSEKELNLTIDKLLKKDDIKELRFVNNNVYFLYDTDTFLEVHSLDYRPEEQPQYETIYEKEREQKFKAMSTEEMTEYFNNRVQFKNFLSEKILTILKNHSMTFEEIKKELKISEPEKEEILIYMLKSLKFTGRIKEIKMQDYSIYYKE